MDLDELWDRVIENYKSLNSDLDIEIKIASDYSFNELGLVYQSHNLSEHLQPYVRTVPITVPGFVGLGHGPVSGGFRLSIVEACIATDFTGEEESLKKRPLMLKFSK